MCLLSNRSQMISNCGKNKKKWHTRLNCYGIHPQQHRIYLFYIINIKMFMVVNICICPLINHKEDTFKMHVPFSLLNNAEKTMHCTSLLPQRFLENTHFAELPDNEWSAAYGHEHSQWSKNFMTSICHHKSTCLCCNTGI